MGECKFLRPLVIGEHCLQRFARKHQDRQFADTQFLAIPNDLDLL